MKYRFPSSRRSEQVRKSDVFVWTPQDPFLSVAISPSFGHRPVGHLCTYSGIMLLFYLYSVCNEGQILPRALGPAGNGLPIWSGLTER